MKYNDNGQEIEIIKPNSNKKKKKEKFNQTQENNNKFISSIIMGIIGIIFLTNSDDIIIYSCYIIGSLVIGFGIFNILSYEQIKKQIKIKDSKKLNNGILTIAIGLIIIILSNIIKTFLNIIIGVWLITNGVTKFITTKDLDTKNKNFGLIESIIYIAMGLYSILIQNIILTLIGIWMIVASIIDIYSKLKK